MRRLNIAVGILIIFALILVFTMKLETGSVNYKEVTDFSGGWTDEYGNETDPMNLNFEENKSVIVNTLHSREMNGRSLCFVSRNVFFDIYVDDRPVYSFHPKLGGIYGKFYGDYIHTVSFPSFPQNAEIRICSEAIIINGWTGFDDMILEDSGEFVNEILRGNIVSFLICVITFMFGFVLFLVGTVKRRNVVNNFETAALGTITMLLSLWANSQTKILQLITGNSAILHVMDYLTLMLLPIPIIMFVASMTDNLKNKLLPLFIILPCLNTVFQFSATLSGLSDYHNTLRVTHIIILTGLIYVICLIVNGIRAKKMSANQFGYIISSLGAIMISGMIDMIRYYGGYTKDPSTFSKLGLLIFAVILAAYEFNRLVEIQVKSGEAEMMQTLAMEDALTGLRSRNAFNEYEHRLMGLSEGKCIFLHFDVNGLKLVNDTYGHAEGDRHIKAAANAIKGAFGEYGQCFRIGGDEFFAILDHESSSEDYERGIERFYSLQRDYNENEEPPVPLAIAHGYAEYSYEDKNPEVAERLADRRMYENKRDMKSIIK